jgi:hypothetical protein
VGRRYAPEILPLASDGGKVCRLESVNLMVGGSGPVATCGSRTGERVRQVPCERGREREAGRVPHTGTDPEGLGSSRAEYPPPDIIFADDGGSDNSAEEVSRGGKGMGLVLSLRKPAA